MGDYISREDVKQLVRDDNDKHGYSERFHNFSIKLWNLPSADVRENRWIPVTEKLPKDHEEVLIYLSTNRITIGLYNSHVLPIRPYKPIGWGVNAKTAVHNFCSDDVIAWQPLPEPYKAKNPETCKGCLDPCIMYEPDMRGCKKKVTEKGETDGK